MALEYSKSAKTILERLKVAHNPKIAKIRAEFFEKENNFFRKHIRNQRVLVSGSGLGHDSFELAKYNKEIVGVELLRPLIGIAKKRSKKKGK